MSVILPIVVHYIAPIFVAATLDIMPVNFSVPKYKRLSGDA